MGSTDDWPERLRRNLAAMERRAQERAALRADLETRRWYGKLRRHAERLDQGGDAFRRRALLRMGASAGRGVVGGPTIDSARGPAGVPESPPEKSAVGY